MILRVWYCTACGPQPTPLHRGQDRRACPTCSAPLFTIDATVTDGPFDGVTTPDDQGGPPPAPGDGGPFDGGAPWPDPFDGLLCGIRFVRVLAAPERIHWQVYVIDPAWPPHDPLGLHLAAMTCCGLSGPYSRPTQFTLLCGDCHQGVADGLAEARIVLRALQADGRLP